MAAPLRPSPYPIHEWPRLTRDEATRKSELARALGFLRDRAAIMGSQLLGLPLSIVPAKFAWTNDSSVSVYLLSRRDRRRAILEFEPDFAHFIVDRTLGLEGRDARPFPLSDFERGVLAYAMATMLAGTDWAVATVATTREARDRATESRVFETAGVEFQTPQRRGWGNVYIENGFDCAPAATGQSLSSLRVTWVIDRGLATLRAAEIDSLALGDVVIPDEWWNEARLHALGDTAATLFLDPTAEGFRVVRAERALTAPLTRKRPVMNERVVSIPSKETPIALSVEIARFTWPLGEVSAMQIGEIVRTGQSVSEKVALRAGELVVATGELVDVEGEIGVRITQLADRR